MSAADLLANVERPAAERPRAVSPVLPDLEPVGERPWCGSVHSEIEHWKQRALVAEGDLAALRAAVRAGWRPLT
jgi:hypothetical protein